MTVKCIEVIPADIRTSVTAAASLGVAIVIALIILRTGRRGSRDVADTIMPWWGHSRANSQEGEEAVYRLAAIVAISAVLLGHPASAGQDSAKALYGVWRLVAFQTQIIGEAAPREPFGPHPFGYLILTPQHRMMAYLSKTDRKPPTNDAEAAGLLRSMIAYTGKFRLEGDKFITTVDGAWNEILKAHEQVRYFSIADDKLTIRTAEQPSGVYPGKRIVSALIWEREK